MIRTPLRPLARILSARARGENPDAIERENRRQRLEQARDQARRVAEGRLLMLGGVLMLAFAAVGVQMARLAVTSAEPPRLASVEAAISSARADITDRRGRVLATNLRTHSLYAQPPQMIDPQHAAYELARIFPDLDAEALERRFTDEGRRFLWIKRRLSPEQAQQVRDIGDPGLLFGPREMRVYPNGALAAHVLGGTQFGREGVSSAEILGVAGVERSLDAELRDAERAGAPLQLSIDLSVQAAMRDVLEGGMRMLNAKGASAVLMDARSGEILGLSSLPDFDPNMRPAPLADGDRGDSPLFNRAVQGVYELGSVMKVFAAAQAMEEGLVTPDSVLDTRGPMRWGRHRISDYRDYGNEMSVHDIIVKSSNIGTARMAIELGAEAQRDFLDRLGFLEPVPVELSEAASGRPLLPGNWSEISAITISYGHGLSSNALHLAAGYAAMVNGGTTVTPTLLRGGGGRGERVIGTQTSERIREMLRAVVTEGTASMAEVPGYRVGGKTGTADKPGARGGYEEGKVISTFAGAFPMDDPRYVFVVTLDEPEDRAGEEPRRTAGWTAVPVAAEIIRRTGPLLGLRPEIEPRAGNGLTPVRN